MNIRSTIVCIFSLFVFGCAHRHQEAQPRATWTPGGFKMNGTNIPMDEVEVRIMPQPGATWTLGSVKMNGTNVSDDVEVRTRPQTGAQSQ
jgi:hypothetical protein